MPENIGTERIKVETAAKILGMSEHKLRIRMQRNLFKPSIGYVMETSGKKKDYFIYRDKLYSYMGKTVDGEDSEVPTVKTGF